MRPLSLILAAQQAPRAAAQRCAAQETMADLRGRLTTFYQRHNPTNLAQIDAILTAWGNNEAEMWRQMAAKYGQRAVDDAAAVVKRERTDDERPMITLPVPILQSMSGCRVTRTRTDLVVATCNADLWPERLGLAKALDEDSCLSVVSFLDYRFWVLLLSTNRSLRKQLQSRPVRRKAAGKRAWYLVVQSMKKLGKCTERRGKYFCDISLSESAKAELALIVKEFPKALEERHLPPYATHTDEEKRPYLIYSRLFSPRQDGIRDSHSQPELYTSSSRVAWHGKLPDSPITPLELAVSWPEHPAMYLLTDLIRLGSQVTELALDITTSNYANDPEDDTGCWINILLQYAPHLVSATQYNLDYLTDNRCTDRHMFMWWIEDGGFVPEVGKTHEADGPFSQSYGQALHGWLANAALGKKRCGKCGSLEPRRNFSEKGWAASNDNEVRCKRCEPPAWTIPVPLGTPRARTCSSCKLHLVVAAFSKAQRKKGNSARCQKCTTRRPWPPSWE